jgi:hypothetical protein
MTTTKETCPKCGAKAYYMNLHRVNFECGSAIFSNGEELTGKDCRITELEKDKTAAREALEIALKETRRSHARQIELEKEVERYHDALALVLPMAKGYAHQHPVGSNQKYCDIATALLEKKGTE